MNKLMKQSLLLAVILSLLVSISTKSNINAIATNDEPSPWAIDEVNQALDNELIPMHMQTDYTTAITREDFCELVIYFIETYGDMGMPAYTSSKTLKALTASPFSDVDNANINSANVLGIANGYPDGEFKPNAPISRQEAAKMLTATAFALGYDVGADPITFNDQSLIGTWATPYINYVNSLGVMKGVSNNNFDPLGTYERQMAFITINRMFNSLPVATQVENPPIDPLQYFVYGLGNAGSYTMKYTTKPNPVLSDYLSYYSSEKGARIDTTVTNFYDETFSIHHYIIGDIIYSALPEKEYMTSYKVSKDSSIMSTILAAVKGDLIAAYIENDYYVYHYQLPFVQSEDMFFDYRFFMKDSELEKLVVTFNSNDTVYAFLPLEFGELAENLFDLPTGYQTTVHDYIYDGEHPPFWWEMRK